MESVIYIAWHLLLLVIPLSLLVLSVRAYDGANGFELLAKLLMVLPAHLFFSGVAYIFTVELVIESLASHGAKFTEVRKLIAAAVIYLYLMSGYLLCSFIKGGFIKPRLAVRARCKSSVLNLD